MNKLALLAAAAITAGSFGIGAAFSQDTGNDFQTVDTNHDGSISWEEAFAVYPTLTEDLFKKADANGDGKLDEGEYTGLQGLTAGQASNGSSEVSSSSSAM